MTCPIGFYCDPTSLSPGQGVIQPEACVAGHYCPTNTSSARQYPCPPGSYENKTGLEKAGDCKLCDGGYYCNGGETEVSGPCSAGMEIPTVYCLLSGITF